jgi:hypothetical protein
MTNLRNHFRAKGQLGYKNSNSTPPTPQEKQKTRTIYKNTLKIKDRVTRTPLKTRGELMSSGRVSSSCSTSDIRRVNLDTNPVISHERGKDRLKSSLRKFYGRHHDLVDRYGISESQMTTDMFHLS